MALTESKLRQIIREEAAVVMKEGHYDGEGYYNDGGDEDDDYWDREFDDDSDDEYDAIKDYAAMTGQHKDTVLRDRMAGRYGRRR
jgi:hypothetical protein